MRPADHEVPVGRRWMMVTAVVGWFVVLVRPDPSVLRAKRGGLGGGRRSPTWSPGGCVHGAGGRLTAVVLVDPLVVGSLGFWLSAAATLGWWWVWAIMARRKPSGCRGPRWRRRSGGAPVLAAAGLAVPLASFPTQHPRPAHPPDS
ncbi:MAG: hypothetical protein IPQ14_01925 [Candidatus Microthrix sp.]|uniref:hypothetical protein n=1 Tax=Candidatus Neomicrothrix sp. TaxID=2719034 RepID=UPI0025BFFC8D|nr:hypothetical protein [Candidatus Microthrix sp.]MBL0203103.1 hypothetical protein [Candidatus Microthrix sp.]